MYVAQNLSKIYINGEIETQILHDINLTIEEGAFVTIYGPSGSGKTTLLNLLSGLDRDLNGTIHFYDECVSQFTEKQMVKYRKEYISFVFQHYHLLPTLNVKENIEVASELSSKPFSTKEILEKVKMLEHADKYPSQLSGGQKQRVAIARAIVKRPKVIFCDEPTGALDSTNAQMVMELLLDLNRNFGTTIIMVTHHEAYAQLATQIVRMHDGKIMSCQKNVQPSMAEHIVW